MKKNIASLNPSNVLDTTAKFFRIMEKEEVPWEKFQIPIDVIVARKNLAGYIKMGCPNLDAGLTGIAMTKDYRLTRDILGLDFIMPDEISRKYPYLNYDEATLENYYKSLPNKEVLEWLRKNDFMLVAGPPTPLTLEEMGSIHDRFTPSNAIYRSYNDENFFREDKITNRWLMLRKKFVPGSEQRGGWLEKWDERYKIISKIEYIPNIAEVTWGIMTYEMIRHKFLLDLIFARVSSLSSSGFPVLIGKMHWGSMVIRGGGYNSDDFYNDIGFLSSRLPD